MHLLCAGFFSGMVPVSTFSTNTLGPNCECLPSVMRSINAFICFQFAVEGVVGLSWGFGLPLYDIVRGTVVDYMHCLCEGVIDQLLMQWFDKSNLKKAFYLGSTVEMISKELTAITPTCDVTRTPRSLADVKDWKGTNSYSF